ncbi:MAG TPA: hypothetical protein VMS00_03095, partial [Acidimicrobiales bacterium]|nr:hypothetical protein [Acidimicrobiales bacterium]
ALAVDMKTDTVYAANDGFCAGTTNSTDCESGTGDTVSVIDGARCNGSVSTGCRRKPALIKVGEGADWTEVDQATGTLYITSYLAGTVSVIDGARCNARVTSACDRPSAVLTMGAGAGYVALDSPLHTLFTLNTESDTLAETNVVTCNGKVTSGCATKPLSQQAAPMLGAYAEPTPNAGVLDPQTATLYVVCVGGGLFMNVVDVSRCSSVGTSGCSSST